MSDKNNSIMDVALWKYILAWLPMVVIAIANGAIREIWYKNSFGEHRANQISVASGCLLLGIYIWAVIRKWQPRSTRHALGIGLVWFSMTIMFEFGFGHFIRGLPWTALLHEYNIFSGRLWPVVLFWVMISPYVFCRWRKTKRG